MNLNKYNKVGSALIIVMSVFLFLSGLWGDDLPVTILFLGAALVLTITAIYLRKSNKIAKQVAIVEMLLLIGLNIKVLLDVFLEVKNQAAISLYLVVPPLILFAIPLVYFLVTLFFVIKSEQR